MDAKEAREQATLHNAALSHSYKTIKEIIQNRVKRGEFFIYPTDYNSSVTVNDGVKTLLQKEGYTVTWEPKIKISWTHAH